MFFIITALLLIGTYAYSSDMINKSWTEALQKIKPTKANRSQRIKSFYEWRPIVAYNQKYSQAESFLLIDWKAIVYYACNKKRIIIPYEELNKHLKEAHKEMNKLNIDKEMISEMIRYTFLYYAIQDRQEDHVILLLKQYGLELSPNQTLVVYDFFTQPEHKHLLPLYLEKNKHKKLKISLDTFAYQNYNDAIEDLKSCYDQIAYQKKLYQFQPKSIMIDKKFLWITKETPLFNLPLKKSLLYCFPYLKNNEQELIQCEYHIDELKKQKPSQDHTSLKKHLILVSSKVKDLERKIESQSKQEQNLKAIAELHSFNQPLDSPESEEFLDNIIITDKILKNNNILIGGMTETVRKKNDCHKEYIRNHYSESNTNFSSLQIQWINACYNYYKNLKEIEGSPNLEKEDSSESIMESLIKKRFFIYKIADTIKSKKFKDEKLILEYQTALKNHRSYLQELLKKNIIKESGYIKIINNWEEEINNVFNKL